jgi:riboflavin synthase alpha subunit
MFTGLIEETGRVRTIRRTATGVSLVIDTAVASELGPGESVAVNGVCLTVTRAAAPVFEVDAVRTTLEATTLGGLKNGDVVNLERALRVGDRLGGHIVSGHVDGVGTIRSVDTGRDGVRVTVEVPENALPFIVPRGSIAIDGISLTVASVAQRNVTVAIIPETLRRTGASRYRAGMLVNIETDILAKQQARLTRSRENAEGRPRGEQPGGITEERLRELGFMERDR